MFNLNQQNVASVVNMGKEKKERKPKWDIDKEYPKWAWADYKLQDSQFFKEVKEFSTLGLDPKHDLIDEHVITLNIATIFGNVKKFKTTDPLLSPYARKEIETFYWKIYGNRHITNNELMAWFVKGWVT
jgi:predicted transcriptional regulator